VLSNIEQNAFDSAFELKVKKSIKDYWDNWQWLFEVAAMILGIIYLCLKFIP